MHWLNDIENRIEESDAFESSPRFSVCGTRIDLRSLPSPKIIVNVDALMAHSIIGPFLRTGKEDRKHCDHLAISGVTPKPIVLMIEAKRGLTKIDFYSEKAYNQLLSSCSIFDEIIHICTLALPFKTLDDCEVQAACVMEGMRGGVPLSKKQRSYIIRMYTEVKVPLTYVPADKSVWDEIKKRRR